jgi:Mn-dependent DtxR family transcriptional regulator
MTKQLTAALEDYLKEIYKLQAASGRATTSALATRRGVAPASATARVGKLAASWSTSGTAEPC